MGPFFVGKYPEADLSLPADWRAVWHDSSANLPNSTVFSLAMVRENGNLTSTMRYKYVRMETILVDDLTLQAFQASFNPRYKPVVEAFAAHLRGRRTVSSISREQVHDRGTHKFVARKRTADSNG